MAKRKSTSPVFELDPPEVPLSAMLLQAHMKKVDDAMKMVQEVVKDTGDFCAKYAEAVKSEYAEKQSMKRAKLLSNMMAIEVGVKKMIDDAFEREHRVAAPETEERRTGNISTLLNMTQPRPVEKETEPPPAPETDSEPAPSAKKERTPPSENTQAETDDESENESVYASPYDSAQEDDDDASS